MAGAKKKPQTAPERRRLLGAVHQGGVALGLDDDARRDVMAQITGHRSAADCTDAQLRAVLREYGRRGWNAPGGRYPKAARPLARKVHALWGQLRDTGALRDGSRAALRSWCARQLGRGEGVAVDPDMLGDEELTPLAEALKGWVGRAKAEREGSK